MRFVVFLAHEEERNARCQYRAECREAEFATVQPIAEGAVADLVVVLCAHHEALRVRRFECARKVIDAAVLRVVTLLLTREEYVHGVVKIVAPLGVMTPAFDWTD